MKKQLAVWLMVVVIVGGLAGCGASGKMAASEKNEAPKATSAQEAPPQATGTDAYTQALEKPVTLALAQSPDGSRLTLQYAAIAICEAAGVPYQWEKSQQRAGDMCKRFVAGLDVKGVPAKQALQDLTAPLGVQAKVDGGGVYLQK